MVRAWAGLRPFQRTGGPTIGRVPGSSNVFVATGHHRNGVLLAAITARTVRACVEGASPPDEAASFAP
jgi:glycine oxidase